MKPGEEAPFEGGVSSPGPSFPEAFDWRGGRATGVPLRGFLYSAIDGRFPLQGRRKMPQSVM